MARRIRAHRKLLAGIAVVAALGAGATIGILLGVPTLSGAQTPAPGPGMGPLVAPFGLKAGIPLKAGISLGIVAKDLNMTPADLRTALQGGQSIAALAKSKNVDPQTIINDLVSNATTKIDAAVSSGKITADQATNMKSKLTTAITAFVNGTRMPKPRGVTGTAGSMVGVKPSFDIVAKDLHLTTAQLKTALQGGQSIAVLAKSKNVDPQTIINDLVADAMTRIDAAVSSGKIPAAQATNLKTKLTTAITAFVNGNPKGMGGFRYGPWGSFHGPGGPGMRGHRPTATATSSI